jgi:hypothetical protein
MHVHGVGMWVFLVSKRMAADLFQIGINVYVVCGPLCLFMVSGPVGGTSAATLVVCCALRSGALRSGSGASRGSRRAKSTTGAAGPRGWAASRFDPKLVQKCGTGPPHLLISDVIVAG